MEDEKKSLSDIEKQRHCLRKWKAAIEAARIPKNDVCNRSTFAGMIAVGKNRFPDVYDNKSWGGGLSNDWSFVIDGDSMVGFDTPSQVRRKVGASILQNGITYICQHHDFYPPYGLYVDYRMVVSSLINKDRCYDAVDMLSEQHMLFISEIYPDPGLNEVVRNMLTFRLDDVMRRRRDNGLVTILSFSRPCSSVMKSNLLGDEIQSLLMKCHEHGSGMIYDHKIVRVVTKRTVAKNGGDGSDNE